MNRTTLTTQTISTPPATLWLNVKDFSTIAGIAERRGCRALARGAEGLPWNGHYLEVRKIEGCQGRGGMKYEVCVSSLPSQLYARWIATKAQQPAIAVPVVQTINLEDCDTRLDPLLSKRTDEAIWRLSIIQPLLEYRRWTPERSAIAKALLKRQHMRPDGSKTCISRSALYEWVSRYEEQGLEGLSSRQRKDAGKSRTLVSRAWDKACPLEEAAQQAVASQLRDYIRSLWRSG